MARRWSCACTSRTAAAGRLGSGSRPRRNASRRANALEDPGAEVESGPDGIVVEYGPFEIVTLRVELER